MCFTEYQEKESSTRDSVKESIEPSVGEQQPVEKECSTRVSANESIEPTLKEEEEERSSILSPSMDLEDKDNDNNSVKTTPTKESNRSVEQPNTTLHGTDNPAVEMQMEDFLQQNKLFILDEMQQLANNLRREMSICIQLNKVFLFPNTTYFEPEHVEAYYTTNKNEKRRYISNFRQTFNDGFKQSIKRNKYSTAEMSVASKLADACVQTAKNDAENHGLTRTIEELSFPISHYQPPQSSSNSNSRNTLASNSSSHSTLQTSATNEESATIAATSLTGSSNSMRSREAFAKINAINQQKELTTLKRKQEELEASNKRGRTKTV
jgi:hypothetical protein